MASKLVKCQHTLGPWKYQENSDAYTHIVRGPNGEFIASCPQGTDGEDEANARLFSAAPEMLAALQDLLYLVDQEREGALILSRADRRPITNGDQDLIDKAFIAAEVAIAKIRGPQ